MRLVGYVRVSTKAQADDGLGLDAQVEGIEEYCAAGGHELVVLHRDGGVSGDLEEIDRPGLSAALRAVVDGGAEGLVVYRLDRLARRLWRQELVIAKLAEKGRVVVSATERDIESDDPILVLLRQVLGVVAEFERAIITRRLQGGRRLKAERGGFSYGSPGYGFVARDKELEADPVEQAALSRMIELQRQGLSLRAIASTLTIEGHRPKRAAKWHPHVIGRIIARATGEAA